jgi:hypothetical protein
MNLSTGDKVRDLIDAEVLLDTLLRKTQAILPLERPSSPGSQEMIVGLWKLLIRDPVYIECKTVGPRRSRRPLVEAWSLGLEQFDKSGAAIAKEIPPSEKSSTSTLDICRFRSRYCSIHLAAVRD